MGTRDAVAVVAGLGRSSSRVADCNSLKQEHGVAENALDKPHSSRSNLFSCFVARSSAAKKSPSSSSHHSGPWPRSPSHIMSRLLLSPDMNPDRILSASPTAGDQSPARGKSRFRRHNRAQREYFSGPLLGNNKKDLFEACAKDEPTSPKVTCMGKVKAPKHKEAAVKAACRRDSKPPKWRQSLQSFSGPLDLSRHGQNSGELALPSSCKKQQQKQQQQQGNCVFGKSLLALQQQEEHKEWAAVESRMDWPSLKNLRIVVQKQDAEEEGEFTRCERSLRIVVPAGSHSSSPDSSTDCLRIPAENEKSTMRKPEEICIWKRRCGVAEPMKLDIRRN